MKHIPSPIVTFRAWKGDVLWEEVIANRRNGPVTLGPYGFEWVFEVITEEGTDRITVPAGVPMTWWPMNEGGVG